jgi:hypothetical protein
MSRRHKLHGNTGAIAVIAAIGPIACPERGVVRRVEQVVIARELEHVMRLDYKLIAVT